MATEHSSSEARALGARLDRVCSVSCAWPARRTVARAVQRPDLSPLEEAIRQEGRDV